MSSCLCRQAIYEHKVQRPRKTRFEVGHFTTTHKHTVNFRSVILGQNSLGAKSGMHLLEFEHATVEIPYVSLVNRRPIAFFDEHNYYRVSVRV
jgi:hypothetical protein